MTKTSLRAFAPLMSLCLVGVAGDLAEHGMFAVEPVGGHVGDEELAAVGAGAGVGHGQDAGAVVAQFGGALVGESITGSPGAGAKGATALDHEVVDHPVELQPVVEAALRQIDEVCHRERGPVGEQVDVDGALVGLDDGFQVGHGGLLRFGWRLVLAFRNITGPCQRATSRRPRAVDRPCGRRYGPGVKAVDHELHEGIPMDRKRTEEAAVLGFLIALGLVGLGWFAAKGVVSARALEFIILTAVRSGEASPDDVDLVLMDMQMARLDGLEATRRIRLGECGDQIQSVPVIALTALALDEERERILESGVNYYLSKPLKLDELKGILKEVAKSIKRA